MTDTLEQLTDLGVSVWLDDLSRSRIKSGDLQSLIENRSVRGVTTNPTIFAQALANADDYSDAVAQCKEQGLDAEQTIFEITSEDVRMACDIFKPIFEESKGVDGRVSIEVSPLLANDTEGTVAQAKQLWEKVDRENLLVKIPATKEGLPAITEAIAAGISVNVTLIFSLNRYSEVIDAYMRGIRQASENGHDVSKIHSVASFFVSRVDASVDKLLEEHSPEASKLKGKAAIANARLAYSLFLDEFVSAKWKPMADLGANAQRPLMASTGVKNPEYSETMYVTELAAPNLVNTMPEKTMEATYQKGAFSGDTITPNLEHASAEWQAIGELVDLRSVTKELEIDGVMKFKQSWGELMETVEKALDSK
jgi:transaldolase